MQEFYITNPKIIKHLYRAYRSLKRKLVNPEAVISFLFAIACALYLSIELHAQSFSLFRYITIITLSALGLLGLMVAMNRCIAHTATKCILPARFITVIAGIGFEIVSRKLVASRFEFATTATSWQGAVMNHEAFGKGMWRTSPEDKHTRNLSHIKRCSKCFMFIKSELDGRFIGFTHIIPVSETTWNEYRKGQIDDVTFNEMYVVPDEGQKTDEKPYGLIIFSVAIAGRNRDWNNPKMYSKRAGAAIEHAVAFHVRQLIDQHFSDFRYVNVMFQNEDRRYEDFFKDVADVSFVSKDEVGIKSFKVKV